MTKRKRIIYWITTIWLALGMVSSGVVQLLGMKEEVQLFNHLGYPGYFLTILAIWKLLGVTAILVPGFPLIKEWAYAGFFFVMSGAMLSHMALGDSFQETVPNVLLLVLTFLSWYFRPADRKIILADNFTNRSKM